MPRLGIVGSRFRVRSGMNLLSNVLSPFRNNGVGRTSVNPNSASKSNSSSSSILVLGGSAALGIGAAHIDVESTAVLGVSIPGLLGPGVFSQLGFTLKGPLGGILRSFELVGSRNALLRTAASAVVSEERIHMLCARREGESARGLIGPSALVRGRRWIWMVEKKEGTEGVANAPDARMS